MITSKEVTDLDQHFQDYFYGLEGYHLRCERFYDELRTMQPQRIREWLRAAFIAGAQCMADDTLRIVHTKLFLHVDRTDETSQMFDEIKTDLLDHYENTFLGCGGIDM